MPQQSEFGEQVAGRLMGNGLPSESGIGVVVVFQKLWG